MKYGFGVDLGGTTVKIALFNEAGDLLDKWEIPTDVSDNGCRILRDISDAIHEYLQRNNIAYDQVIGSIRRSMESRSVPARASAARRTMPVAEQYCSTQPYFPQLQGTVSSRLSTI